MPWHCLIIETAGDYAEALSDALLELGASSVDLLDARAETPDEQAIFGEPGEPPPGPWQHNRVSALFSADVDITGVLSRAAEMAGMPQVPGYRVETLPDSDWVRLTQSQFKPIAISRRLWIVPSWHSPHDANAINIVLDPGLAFGTGSHPTTRLCLQWLDDNLRGGESVLDYGCGSGILAIAAIKLGAARAIGVDVDLQAVIASRNNAAANQTPDARFYLADDCPSLPGFDVVVANILTNPLRLLAPVLAGATRPGGRIVLSGILEVQADEVRNIYQNWLDMDPPVFDEGWSLLSGCRR